MLRISLNLSALLVCLYMVAAVPLDLLPSSSSISELAERHEYNNKGYYPNGTRVQPTRNIVSREEICQTNTECLKRKLPLRAPRASRTRSALRPRGSSMPQQ